MACGTPSSRIARGSMPEVVDEGITGYLASSVAEAVEVLDDALKLDRHQVHGHAVGRFSADRMVEDYLRLYTRLLS